jgi:FHA domain-containing protein
MKLRHSKPATDEDEIETGTSTETSTPQTPSTGNWKCPSCGAENEDYRTFCDGCGDKRPGAKVSSKGIDMASILGSSEPSDNTSSSWEDSSPKKEKGKKSKKSKKDKDDEEAEPLKAEPPEPLEAEKIEPAEPMTPSDDQEAQKPSFVLTGPTAEPEPDENKTFAPSLPSFQPAFPSSSEQTTQPSHPTSGERYFLVFVNTPASSLIKTRVSIDFDDFPTITIGRSPENVVVIPDQEVSRKHASLSFNGSKLLLKDLGSLNGTFFYDGKEFQRVSDSVEVRPNAVLKFGTGTIVKLVSE